MGKQINVVTHEGELMESTYPKRAKQLVKLNRAKWTDGSTICLLKNEKELAPMEYNSNGPRYVNDTEAEIEFAKKEPKRAIPVYEKAYTDEELYELARRNVKKRSALIIHVFAYISVNIFLFFIAALNREAWNFYVLGGWGIGLVCHAASYFSSGNHDSVQREYMKLKNRY